jgi:very-short-patch-repair endonuclease
MRDDQKRDVARVLRRDATDAERAMWRLLRSRRFAELKFRRQVPIGPYVADFACVSKRLIVEIDGGQHAQSDTDRRRDAYLKRDGWIVVRFWNNEVLENPEGVLLKIAVAAGVMFDRPSPLPSPARGRGGRQRRRDFGADRDAT